MGVTASKHVEKSWPLSSLIEATLSPPCTVEPLLAHTSGWIRILGSRGYEVGRVGLSRVLQFYKGCMVPTCCEIYEVNFSGTIKKAVRILYKPAQNHCPLLKHSRVSPKMHPKNSYIFMTNAERFQL